ncbi:dihydrodipicolinate synthase family protein [Nitratireductor luteus]|uniref:dihydrodipicolinate synthase family protein n=1 Tax=Nitratireductor luteus TaxID=2976980 RepID=UPI002240DCAC|nr:dihydrodipicolinate synthase family protein [Nitratireductor luteus]
MSGSPDLPRGIWAAVLLPVSAQGEIDWGALAEEISILCEGPVDGLYTNGTAGEFHSQTEAEYERLTALMAEIAGKAGKPFQIGVNHTNARIARARLSGLGPLRPTGAQIILPDWWPPGDAEVARFIDGMHAAAGDVPLILYNPPHAKKRLTLAQIAGLRALAPGLIGAKLPGGDAQWHAERRRLLPEFSVFVPGHTVATARPLGADGSYSNMACLSPFGAAMHWRMIESDPAAAGDLERRANLFLRDHVLPFRASHGLSDAALDKLMAAAGGWGPVSSRLLWPYTYASQEDVQRLATASRKLMPEYFGIGR